MKHFLGVSPALLFRCALRHILYSQIYNSIDISATRGRVTLHRVLSPDFQVPPHAALQVDMTPSLERLQAPRLTFLLSISLFSLRPPARSLYPRPASRTHQSDLQLRISPPPTITASAQGAMKSPLFNVDAIRLSVRGRLAWCAST